MVLLYKIVLVDIIHYYKFVTQATRLIEVLKKKSHRSYYMKCEIFSFFFLILCRQRDILNFILQNRFSKLQEGCYTVVTPRKLNTRFRKMFFFLTIPRTTFLDSQIKIYTTRQFTYRNVYKTQNNFMTINNKSYAK